MAAEAKSRMRARRFTPPRNRKRCAGLHLHLDGRELVVRAEVLREIRDQLRFALLIDHCAPADHLVDARRPLLLREALLHEDVRGVAGKAAAFGELPARAPPPRPGLRAAG